MPVTDSHPFKSPEARARYLAAYEQQASSWPVPSETAMVSTSDGETFVRISGPADGPPLVLLPAGRSNGMCWAPLIESLARKHRVYALDAIYDDGLSVSARPIKTIEDATGWLDGVLGELGLSCGVKLAGISFGAWLAAEYLLAHPERLSKVVWVSPVGVVAPMSGEFIARSMACLIPSERTFRWVTRWIMPDAAEREPEFFEDAVAEMALSEKCFKFRMWPGGGPRKLTDDQLGGIAVPVLYVVGENERICSDVKEAVARIESVAPRVQTCTIANAGHDAVWVETEQVRSAMSEFLS